MNCEKVQSILPHHFYGELSTEETKKLHAHLSECSYCQAEERKLIRLMREMDRVDFDVLPEDFDEKLQRKIGLARKPKSTKFSLMKSIAFAVAALLILSIGIRFIFADLFTPGKLENKSKKEFFASSVLANYRESNIPSYFDKMKNEIYP